MSNCIGCRNTQNARAGETWTAKTSLTRTNWMPFEKYGTRPRGGSMEGYCNGRNCNHSSKYRNNAISSFFFREEYSPLKNKKGDYVTLKNT